jgi:hypothetical protein
MTRSIGLIHVVDLRQLALDVAAAADRSQIVPQSVAALRLNEWLAAGR